MFSVVENRFLDAVANFVSSRTSHLAWRGLQKIVDWLLDLPISVVVAVIALALTIGVAVLETRPQPPRKTS
jgi:hypothetical protein